MAEVIIYILISVLGVSLISLVGVFTLPLKEEKLKQILIYFVSFSAGGLLGNVFFHLLPEAAESSGKGFSINIALFALLGIIACFVLEKFIRWRHCHVLASERHPHPFSYLILFSDGFHNFIDGLIIASSYLVSVPLGLATTLAVVFHEIPQEIGDFGSLLHGGFNRSRALFFNFLSAAFAVLGAIVVLFLKDQSWQLTGFLIPFAAGNFLYIASSDLVPELHKEVEVKKSFWQLIFFLGGLATMFLLK